MSEKSNSTTRFSNRVEDYVKYRPLYPREIVPYLEGHHAFHAGMRLADIGAGTGISSELFLKAGYAVVAVEPNREMREKSEHLLASYDNFRAANGTAEATTLASASCDAIIAGQAFHWFERGAAKEEFRRILKPGGPVVLLWNERRTSSDFEKDYDALIVRHARDYVQVDHRNIGSGDIGAFFAPYAVTLKVFDNAQVFDLAGLTGRLLSSSYMPATGEEGYEAMLADLNVLFEKYQQQGHITIHYDTKVYVSRLS